MKRILVTGENSYIGTSFVTYMEQFKEEYEVETISVRGDEWREKDFSNYDAVFHVAAIVHKKETKKNIKLYNEINYILTKKLAAKAKNNGVKQFIFLSTMSVYGITNGIIDEESPISPKSEYGKSKYKAEKALMKLSDNNFVISIVRPPMVYGKNCKGNYVRLSNFIKKTLIFPYIENARSMIYIENLNEFIKKIIKFELSGTFHPQNKDYVSTKELCNEVAYLNNKKILFVKIPILEKIKIKVFLKVFGTLIYDTKLSNFNLNYNNTDFKKSIIETEGK